MENVEEVVVEGGRWENIKKGCFLMMSVFVKVSILRVLWCGDEVK